MLVGSDGGAEFLDPVGDGGGCGDGAEVAAGVDVGGPGEVPHGGDGDGEVAGRGGEPVGACRAVRRGVGPVGGAVAWAGDGGGVVA